MGLTGNHRHASNGAATVPGGRERGTCRGRQDTCPAKTQRTIDKTSTLARKQHKAALILNKSLSLTLSLSHQAPLTS